MVIGDWGFRAAFVGRDRELGQLQAYIKNAIAGEGEVVFIEGEAGIGKTRLVEEARKWIESLEREVRFITGRCLYHEDVNPYLPFLDALREYAQSTTDRLGRANSDHAERTTQELEKLMPFGIVQAEDPLLMQSKSCPELLPMSLIPMGMGGEPEDEEEEEGARGEALDRRIGELDINEERERMFRTITSLLISISSETPLVLVLDDIHWADRASLQLLPYVADRTKDEAFLIICTYRPEDLEDFSAQMRTHPLIETIQRMSRMNLFSRITLSRLSVAETKLMVQSLFDQRSLPDSFIEHVYHKTEGNPFFIEEVGRALIEEGTIDVQDPSWPKKIDLSDVAIPETINDVISRRLSRLNEETLRTLRLASVIGRSFHFAILLQAADIGEEALLDVIDEVLEARLVREDFSTDEEVYKFDNIAIREVVYKMLSRSRRRVLHKKVAEALECLYQDNLDAVVFELAHHFMAAKKYRRAAPYLMKAGEFAKRSFAPDDARMFYQRALVALQKLSTNAEVQRLRKEILLELGELNFVMAEWNEAIDCYRSASKLCRMLEDEKNAGFSYRRLGHIFKEKGRWATALDYYSRAHTIAESIEDWSGVADTQRGIGYVHWRRGEFEDAIRNYNKSIENSQRAGNIAILGQTFIEIGNIYGDKSEWDMASKFYHKAIEILSGVGDLNELARAYNNLGDLYLQQEEWEKALDRFQECHETSKKVGNRSMIAWSSFNMAECYVNMDRIDRAESLVNDAEDILEELDEKIGIAAVYRISGKIEAKKGHFARAEGRFKAAIEILDALNIPFELGNAYYELACLYVRKDRYADAEELLGEAKAALEQIGAADRLDKVEELLRQCTEGHDRDRDRDQTR